MDFELIWTESALLDLEQIVRYYREEQKSSEAALRVGTEILERVELLKSFPDIGPVYPKNRAFTARCCVSNIESSTASTTTRRSSTSLASGMVGRISES